MAYKYFTSFILLFTCFLTQAQTGIGTTTPAVKLHVKSNGSILRLEGSDHAYMELFPQGAITRYGYFGYPSASATSLTLMNQFSNGSLIFGTNNTNKMFLSSDGKLGLGQSTPASALHIENGNSIGTGDPGNNIVPSIYVFNNNNASSTANSIVGIRTGGANGGKPYLSIDIANVSGYSLGINNPTDQLILNTTWNFNTGTASNNAITINRSGQSRVVIPSDGGVVSAGWPSGWGGGLITYDFACAGIYYTTLSARSDKRLKNTIVDLDSNFISKYLQLRPVNYYWNDGSDNKHRQFGLIAQEVELVFPEMVSTANDSMQTKSVNYQALHALSLKVIQAQQADIVDLKKKQVEMEARLLKLEAKLN